MLWVSGLGWAHCSASGLWWSKTALFALWYLLPYMCLVTVCRWAQNIFWLKFRAGPWQSLWIHDEPASEGSPLKHPETKASSLLHPAMVFSVEVSSIEGQKSMAARALRALTGLDGPDQPLRGPPMPQPMRSGPHFGRALGRQSLPELCCGCACLHPPWCPTVPVLFWICGFPSLTWDLPWWCGCLAEPGYWLHLPCSH